LGIGTSSRRRKVAFCSGIFAAGPFDPRGGSNFKRNSSQRLNSQALSSQTMDSYNSIADEDAWITILSESDPIPVSEALAKVIKKVLSSPQDESKSAAQETDSLLSTHLETQDEEKATFKDQRYWAFFSELDSFLVESALQTPIGNELVHSRIAELIIRLPKVEREDLLERDQIYKWQDLPELWITFEETWHNEFGVESLAHSRLF